MAAYDGELMVKRLRYLEERPYLMPENPSYVRFRYEKKRIAIFGAWSPMSFIRFSHF
ncbi:MAG: hypothetical protein GVY17_15455 [Cyanobacteria bacterium]|nr:hypothetical protein [Cyanobacteria bacterium GSL.Bin21]